MQGSSPVISQVPPRTSADDALVNLMACLQLTPGLLREREEAWAECLREILPRVSRSNPRIEPVADAADRLLVAFDRREPCWRYTYSCSKALGHYFAWEAADALDLARKEHRGVA